MATAGPTLKQPAPPGIERDGSDVRPIANRGNQRLGAAEKRKHHNRDWAILVMALFPVLEIPAAPPPP